MNCKLLVEFLNTGTGMAQIITINTDKQRDALQQLLVPNGTKKPTIALILATPIY